MRIKRPESIGVTIYTICLISAILMLLCSKAYPVDICLGPESAKGIVVELEQCRIQKEELSLCTEAVRNLEQTVEIQNQEVDIYKSAIEDARKAADGYKSLLDEQRKMYETALKESKPSLFEQVIKALGFIGGGILIGVLL